MDFTLKDPLDMTPQERLDTLAKVLAEGFLYLVQNGLLEEVLTDPLPAGECGEGTEMARAETGDSSALSGSQERR